MVSSTSTPKLNTSDFTEKSPSIAYSGDMYPLTEQEEHHIILAYGKQNQKETKR